MTGRLEGLLFGRPVELVATGRELLLHIADLRSAWRLRRFASAGFDSLLVLLHAGGISLQLQAGSLASVQILPRPNFVVRLLLPALDRIRN